MSENRKRNQTLSIRLTPAEKDAIVKQAAKARMSHQGTTPLISSSYPIKADNIGINVKLMLTQSE